MKGLGNTQQTLSALGVLVTVSALCAVAVRFTTSDKTDEPVAVDNKVTA